MLDQLQEVLRQELSDLPDTAGVFRVALRLLLAAALGALLGYEREHRGKAAGVRTHMLVAMGATLFVLVPQQAGASQSDLSRVIQGLTAGIGFLGVAAIVKGRDDTQIYGLTTAAGIWMTAAIGVAAGMGREATAIFSTVLAFIVLRLVPHVPHPNGAPRDGE